MNRDYSVYIFDFDGTLADSRINIANSLNASFTLNGYQPVPNQKIFPLIGKKTLEQHFIEFYPQLSSSLIPKLVEDFRAHQLDYLEKELQLFPHVVEVLNELKQWGKTLAILTTKGTEQITKMLTVLGIKQLFEYIYGQDLPYGEKPEGRCVDYILTQVSPSVLKKEVVMVGDTEIDIQTAVNAGVDSIGVSYGIGSREELINAGATHIIDVFEELLRE